jgi:hypothetical protein
MTTNPYIFCIYYGGEVGCLWKCGLICATSSSPSRQTHLKHWWNDNRSIWSRNCSITNSTLTALGLKPGVRDEKRVTVNVLLIISLQQECFIICVPSIVLKGELLEARETVAVILTRDDQILLNVIESEKHKQVSLGSCTAFR